MARVSGDRAKPLKMAGMEIPRSPRDQKFCQRWLVHKDEVRAYREAGFSESSMKNSWHKKKLQKFLPYLSSQLEHREVQVAKKFALDQQQIIDEMIAIGFANPQDYLKEEMRETEVDGKKVSTRVLVRKDIMELTRRQAAAISNIVVHADGTVTYSIPDDPKSKHPYLKDLGQHLGLFHPKLIQEHRHSHLHAKLTFADLDEEKLEQFESQLLDAMGPAGQRMLGILPDIEDVEYEEVRND